MNTRQIFWLVACGLVLSTFFVWIPVDVYENSSIFFTISGAILFFVCLFLLLGDYGSVYELIEDLTSKDRNRPQPGLRKAAPFAVIPAIILLIVLIIHQINRVDKELSTNGVLAKGIVSGGRSETTTRRFQSNTTYKINVTYYDSLKHQHVVNSSVNGSDFNDLYQGATIDVVYSRRFPSLAKPIIGLDELSKYKKIARDEITIEHLTSILDQKVKADSIIPYLNSICYEWVPGKEGLYSNEKLSKAIKLFPEGGELAYVIKISTIQVYQNKLEDSFEKYGFKKKASESGGERSEFYYNDTHAITIETKNSDRSYDSNNLMASFEGFRIYHIARIDAVTD
ncbi:MAG: hypothetical protein DI538_15725 [Azospira oryzae]|nr:MAG: hypothetical protein DI538_15725 [Azospira oryzae]